MKNLLLSLLLFFAFANANSQAPNKTYGEWQLLNATKNVDGYLYNIGNGLTEFRSISLPAAAWSLTGNSGTTSGTNFIGTTDNISLLFKVNNYKSGWLDVVHSNTGFGMLSLYSNTTGEQNAAFGYKALMDNTEGNYNTASGYQALENMLSGLDNVGIGWQSGHILTTGSNNVAIGSGADFDANNTQNAIALGYGAVAASNTFTIGNSSLNYIKAPGIAGSNGQVLTNDGSGNWSFETPSSSGWSLTGNAGTTAGTNFIGTTDAISLAFKLNSTNWGKLDYALGNVSFGNLSLNSNTTGIENVAIGTEALKANTDGIANVAIGYNALLANTLGNDNIAIGEQTLQNNIGNGSDSGTDNIAIGAIALGSNISGSLNVAIGRNALAQSTGASNVAIGAYSGNYATTSVGEGQFFLNNQDRTNYLGDTTKSLVYGQFNATAANQRFKINGRLEVNDGTQGAGKVLTSDANGLSSWQTPASGGITSLNGLTGATQTFATGTSGTDFAISSSGIKHTFNIPTASASNRGLLSSADWTTFNNKGSGTVTSVAALTLGTTGTDLSSSVATGTTTPVITLNVPTASASNRGALSSTDWSTFNGKESALTFSTGLTRATNTITNNLSTGVSGGQTIIGGTASGNNLTYSSTSNATKGFHYWGSSTLMAFDETNGRLGIGQATPTAKLEVVAGALATSARQALTVTGSGTSGQTLIGALVNITSTSGGSNSYALRVKLNAGNTGGSANSTLENYNAVAGTGTTLNIGSAFTSPLANVVNTMFASATTTGTNIGGYGDASGGNTNYGLVGKAVGTKNSGVNIGTIGIAANAGTSPINIGGYFGMQTTEATIKGSSVALAADNGTTTSNIFEARDGGTSVFTVADGGAITATGAINLTDGANKSVGVSAAMTAGTITISNTRVTANSRIFLTHATLGGTQGILSVGTIVAGTSFVINSSSATDTGTVNWLIIN